ncbi:MAG: hypothetical protein NVS2B9_14360 [Myxococcales bacterium]
MLRPHCTLMAIVAVFAAGPQAARADRPPLQQDFDRCALRATERGDRSLAGQVRFDLLKRADGQVYAAFVHGEGGVSDRAFERCATSAMILWAFGPVQKIDYSAPYPLSITVGSSSLRGDRGRGNGVFGDAQNIPEVHLPGVNDRILPMELNGTAARETLELLETATLAEQGTARLAVRDTAAARALFEQALARSPDDPMAMRGLAVALAEDAGELARARTLAEKVIAAQPRSEAGHEALLRVCLAAKDDRCAVEQWKAANAAEDLAPRAYGLRALEAATRTAAARLGASAKAGPGGGAASPPGPAAPGDGAADPCAAEQGEEKQALCVVKRCLDAGSADYAKELSVQNAVDYQAGEWRAKLAGAGRLLVTRPISPRTAGTGESHDALWLVKLGDNLVIQPSNTEARQITLTHNACGSRPAPK